MYEEEKKRINWGKTTLEVFLFLLVILLSTRLVIIIRSKQKDRDLANEYNEVLANMDNYAKSYFKNNLPDQSGKSTIIYLNDLVEDKKITKPDNCSLDESYIKVTRLDTEYQIKSYLICDNFENSLNSFEELATTIVIKPTTSTTVPTKTTSKKTTTKIKKYSVSFNPNGGSLVNDIIINENSIIINEPIPVREGYKFLGWYYHGQQFNFSTRINQDYVLTARWVKE